MSVGSERTSRARARREAVPGSPFAVAASRSCPDAALVGNAPVDRSDAHRFRVAGRRFGRPMKESTA
ncbi:MAG TPA: hypothetical protein DCQ98_15405 [Planctomycetaceae bacterium]|nr:hypothetical protein [Planctomycetaceae bacterium]